MKFKSWLNLKTYLITAFVIIAFLIIFHNMVFKFLEDYQNSNFRNILEILYFLSSPLLFIIAFIGLQQLKISKENNKINAKRDAFKLSAERCNYFLNNVIPMADLIDNLIVEESINGFGSTKIIINENHYELHNKPNFKQMDDIMKIMNKITPLLNSLEAFSLFFTSNIADERVAFSSIGQAYCSTVEVLLPLICLVSEGGKLGFNNVIKLYIEWNSRIEKEEALIQKIKAEKKLKQNSVFSFKSLGT